MVLRRRWARRPASARAALDGRGARRAAGHVCRVTSPPRPSTEHAGMKWLRSLQARHARRHALGKHHPVIAPMPIGRDFTWCHEEDAFVG